jgi:hypothetical protein
VGTLDDYVLTKSKLGTSSDAIAFLAWFNWAFGWNSMQYLLTAELFPLRIRGIATSISVTPHLANQNGNSRAALNMLLSTDQGGLTPKGTFWLFAAITTLGVFLGLV